MSTYASLFLISIGIGMLVGAVGVGGFLMPAALTLMTNGSMHQSMATSLFAFIFTGIAGAIYFHRKGSIDWRLVQPVCLGAALTGFAGTWMASMLSVALLSVVLAVVIMIAGVYTLLADSEQTRDVERVCSRRQWIQLACVGALTGFLSGLTGIGGPTLSVPLILLCGFSILMAIGVSQVLQIVCALSGSIINIKLGTIDYGLAMLISGFQMCGVLLGAYVIHRVRIGVIKKSVGALSLVAGGAFMLRAI